MKNVLVVFGKGGHETQAKRFLRLSNEENFDLNYIFVTDSDSFIKMNDKTFQAKEVRSKNESKYLSFILSTINNFFKACRLVHSLNTKGMISFGPGLVVPYALVCKVFGKKVVHIETWSRFTSKSLTGRIMYLLSDEFYIQNLELMELYPRAIYAGRL
ncbi:PssD/Cps14F family polysaccharide biosynthesis glycosyltransferase [Vibrio rumoiensis]|uniref:PssD/Cps14F family polysaccharide biosynthesis glycosyltransferase n=1 Tax=Vibrio rumoiensis TaxID=76258 RepID=UPI0037497B13